MKKIYISLLIFYLLIHIIIPYTIYQVFGFHPIYPLGSTIERSAINKVVLLNFIPILCAILFILVLPKAQKQLESNLGNILPYYIIVLIYSTLSLYFSGGFVGIRAGNNNGTVFGYLSIFLNYWVILVILITSQKKRFNIGLVLFTFVLVKTISGSRSGPFTLIFAFIFIQGFQNFQIYKKKFLKYLLIFLILSPFLFIFATLLRDKPIGNVMNTIIGRISTIETGAFPIMAFDQKNEAALSIFYDKYNFFRQLQLSFDSFFPGNLFEFDIHPNQYYRSAFFGRSLESSFNYYVSINMTLPVYFYMYFGFYGSILLTTLSILLIYICLLFSWTKNRIMFFSILLSVYGVLFYFDFVKIISEFISIYLTAAVVFFISKKKFILGKHLTL